MKNDTARRDGCSFVPTKTGWHDRDRLRPGRAGCHQCRVESNLSGNQRLCVERISVYLKRRKLLRELLAVYKINSVGAFDLMIWFIKLAMIQLA